MSKKIVVSWLVVLILVFLSFNFLLIKNGLAFLLLLTLLPLIPFLTIFLNKETKVKRIYYIYGLVLPAALYYAAFFMFNWIVYNAINHFTGLG
jgi:hypothetical protein